MFYFFFRLFHALTSGSVSMFIYSRLEAEVVTIGPVAPQFLKEEMLSLTYSRLRLKSSFLPDSPQQRSADLKFLNECCVVFSP